MKFNKKILIGTSSIIGIGAIFFTINSLKNILNVEEEENAKFTQTIDFNYEMKKPILDYQIKYSKDKKPFVELNWENKVPDSEVRLYKDDKLIYSGNGSSYIDKNVIDDKKPEKPKFDYAEIENDKAVVHLLSSEDTGDIYRYRVEVENNNEVFKNEIDVEVGSDLKIVKDGEKKEYLNIINNSFEIDLVDGKIPTNKLYFEDFSKNKSSKSSLRNISVLNENIRIEEINFTGLNSSGEYLYDIIFYCQRNLDDISVKLYGKMQGEYKHVRNLKAPVSKLLDFNNQPVQNMYVAKMTFNISPATYYTSSEGTQFEAKDNTIIFKPDIYTGDLFPQGSSTAPIPALDNYGISLSNTYTGVSEIAYLENQPYGKRYYEITLKDASNNKQVSHITTEVSGYENIEGYIINTPPSSSRYKLTIKTYFPQKGNCHEDLNPSNASTSSVYTIERDFIMPFEWDIFPPDLTLNCKENLKMFIKGFDMGSGLDRVEITHTDSSVFNEYIDMSEYLSKEVIVPQEGVYIVKLYDKAGNMTTKSIEAFETPNITTILPDLTINKNPDEEISNGSVRVTVTQTFPSP